MTKNKNFDELTITLSDLQQGGTDLMSLAKDMLLYFDTQFSTDPDWYSQMTTVRAELIREMKGSSMPLVMMKAKLWKVI